MPHGIKRSPEEEPDSIHSHLAVAPPPRKRTAASSRTGQACDRCKIRKIRCDATLGGCTPCRQNGSECKTTDRITGRATARGHTEHLENELTGLKMYVIELQAQLKHSGIEPGPPPAVSPDYVPPQMVYETNGYGGQSTQKERHGSQGSLLPEFRQGCIGDNYVGVASENNWLSPIEGTSLALFGTKIDLAEYVPPEDNSDASALSYQTFLSYAYGGAQVEKPNLPNYDEYKMYADIYFRGIQPFIPILHKPDFMPMLSRIYHEGYRSNPAEEVMVHMVLAVMFFQWSARNPAGSEQFRSSSFQHYHHALTFVPQLMESHKLQDMQALALICSYLRSQPRPAAAWMFTNMVLGLAIESGLHRSITAWPAAAADQDEHKIEMRKRVFWSIMVFHVTISGKLGRPMPLRFEDFDIEIPEAVNDSLPDEVNVLKWKKCSFRAGILGFKLLKIMMRVYSTIYSIRSSSEPYEVNVRQVEKELQAFQSQVPPELAGGAQTREEDRVSALYLQLSETECQLLLHHPSLNRSNSPQTASHNLDICLEASNKMLMAATQLKQLKSLDTTWYFTTNFLAAIFTTLFAYYEKRDQLTQDSVQRLRQDMDSWLDVMGDVGNLLGTGPKLQAAIRNIGEYSLSHINRRVTERTASAAMASAVSPAQDTPQQQHQQPQPQQQTYTGQDYYAPSTHFYPQESQTTAQHQYHQTAPMPTYDTSSAYTAEGMRHNIEAQLNAELGRPQTTPQSHHQQSLSSPHPQQAPTNFMAAFAAQQAPTTPQQQQSHNSAALYQQAQAFPQAGPAAWRHFTDNMMNVNMTGQDGYGAANLGMGNSGDVTGGMGGSATHAQMAAATFGGMQMPADGTQAWPGIVAYGAGQVGGDGS